MMRFILDKNSRKPYYSQLVEQFEKAAKSGQLQDGEILPSMNVLASKLDLSKETVKKTYGILRDRGLIEPRQGKGFYVKQSSGKYQSVLIICDGLSIYKQILLSALQTRLTEKGNYEITVLVHNQKVDLLRYYLDLNLHAYDWFVVIPHFPLDAATQKGVLRQLGRIPNRKLILLDRWTEALPGNYGVVYQDFGNDACEALEPYANEIRQKGRLSVIALDSSLYKDIIEEGLRAFAAREHINALFSSGLPDEILPGDVCLILSSQLENGLVAIKQKIEEAGLEIGRNIFIIGYNDFPLNDLVMGGLTTISTDFALMGETAANMIASATPARIHNVFRLVRRKTF